MNGNTQNRVFGVFNANAIIATTFGNGIIPEIQVQNSPVILEFAFIFFRIRVLNGAVWESLFMNEVFLIGFVRSTQKHLSKNPSAHCVFTCAV